MTMGYSMSARFRGTASPAGLGLHSRFTRYLRELSARFSLTFQKEANVRLIPALLLTDATQASGINCSVI